jgi:sigma-B regulation protein RsbU (phosphoserine phosphatase)
MLPTTAGVALGLVDGIEYQQTSVAILPGDTLFLYTDGVTEAMNEAGEEFGVERLCAVLAATPSNDPQKVNEAVFAGVRAFAGETPQSDDITCLTLCRSEAPE